MLDYDELAPGLLKSVGAAAGHQDPDLPLSCHCVVYPPSFIFLALRRTSQFSLYFIFSFVPCSCLRRYDLMEAINIAVRERASHDTVREYIRRERRH